MADDGDDGQIEDMEDVMDAFDELIDGEGLGEALVDSIPGLKPELRKLYTQHPELIIDYLETVVNKIPLKVVEPTDTKPDENHTTYPFLTPFEKTRILGMRANQLSQGARPFIDVPKTITDVRDIARLEVEEKKLPFLVLRTLPNGRKEYWRLSDLMLIH
jgi:DNA-directed RNA polymerase I, II, and III subunit RPABC2